MFKSILSITSMVFALSYHLARAEIVQDYEADGTEQSNIVVPFDLHKKAIDTFKQAQEKKSYKALNEEIASLKKQGMTQAGTTRAVLLSKDCGVTGCQKTFLTTTPYETEGANSRSHAVGAIVHCASFQSKGAILRIVGAEEISQLISGRSEE